tara:strand:+ start:94 stop:858 length:765 start_codon:yes stop_codon:yes gene_type:complete
MGYFRELPNLLYQSFLPSKNSSLDYMEVKNIFRRSKVRDDLQNIFTVFDKYEIPDEYRPETVAEEMYGSAELDWVVLTTANIINVRNDWPLSNRDIYDFALNKYGNDLNATRYYETKEVKDSRGKLILPEGKRVDSDFSVVYWDIEDENGWNIFTEEYAKASKNEDEELMEQLEKEGKKYKKGLIRNTNCITGISNYIHELKLNDKKREIYLLKNEYLGQFLNDFRDVMVYGRSSEYVDDDLIQTENTNITMPY